MGMKFGFSLLGLFKGKRRKERRNYYEEEMQVGRKQAYRVWPSDEDRLNWVADPQIDAKATAFLNAMRQQLRDAAADHPNASD